MSSVIIQGAKHSYNLTNSYHVKKQVPTIAFLHGWMLSQAYWQPLISQLQPDFQCLSYDLRGFGLSEIGDRNDYSLISYARDLEELLDHLELSQEPIPFWVPKCDRLVKSWALIRSSVAPLPKLNLVQVHIFPLKELFLSRLTIAIRGHFYGG